MSTQSFKSHARWDPAFHFFLAPILLVNVIFSIIWFCRYHTTHFHAGSWIVIMSIALLLLAGKARGYALKVQDRLIRMEEKTRLALLATPAELAEFDSHTTDQYIGLRFASNPEVVELARRAVREKLDRKQIKAAIKSWRPDNERV